MGSNVFPASSGGLSVARFPAAPGNPFQIPAGLTLQATVTSTTTYTAGQLPAQVWAVIIGGGGGGSQTVNGSASNGGGGGGGVVIGWVDVPSAGITATIGAGGDGPATGPSGGGKTYFGNFVAYGGGCGKQNSYAPALLDGIPQGIGTAGWGGFNATSTFTGTNKHIQVPAGAPFTTNSGMLTFSTGASGLGPDWNNFSAYNNYVGGGAGGSNTWNSTGGSGLTAGGGNGSSYGGNSSRDFGFTNSFTGGTGSVGGGGGAGFLANGTNSTGARTPGNGGSGGGGGGAGGNNASGVSSGGVGGAGCILIYY